MTFSDFANRIRSATDDKGRTDLFTQELLERIVDDPDVIPDNSPKTFASYYNGHTGITKLSKAITPHIDVTKFLDYIEYLPESSQDLLCYAFQDIFPDANPSTIGDQLSTLFVSIIYEAVQKKKNPPQKKASQYNEYAELKSTADFFYWCFTRDSTIEEIHMAFYTGNAWLTDPRYARLLHEFKERNIPIKIIVDSTSNNAIGSAKLVCFPVLFDDVIAKWRVQCKKFTNIELQVSSKPLMRRTYIVQFSDGSGIARIKDYVYAYSELNDDDRIEIFTSENPLYAKYDREFNYLFSESCNSKLD